MLAYMHLSTFRLLHTVLEGGGKLGWFSLLSLVYAFYYASGRAEEAVQGVPEIPILASLGYGISHTLFKFDFTIFTVDMKEDK